MRPRVRVIRSLLALGLTLEDIRRRAHRLELLVQEQPSASCARGPGGFSDVVADRLQALDAEIARLTHLRQSLAAAAQGSPGGACSPTPRNDSVPAGAGRTHPRGSRDTHEPPPRQLWQPADMPWELREHTGRHYAVLFRYAFARRCLVRGAERGCACVCHRGGT
ncbi:MerR family DNA-binding protein [Streptomyces sp. NPDC015130]|uniref:MerR family DNA-binding protein n=1 Tax=Streptomyces sp. NPDC015130 TaxID=3364940 RepID=UPI0036FDCC8F